MAVKPLCLGLILALLWPSWAEKGTCSKSASTCEECIQSGPECAWCTQPHANISCGTVLVLLTTGCNEGYIYNPPGLLSVLKNDSNTDAANAATVFLQPQDLDLRLRPGVSQSFPLTITTPTNQPITELTMDTSPVPEGVNITFSSIENGNPLVLQVTVEATRCRSKSDWPWSVLITPRGFSLSVNLDITLKCQCDCLDRCRKNANEPLCSGRGKCVEDCWCNRRENQKERYSGKYCECSNFDCPYHNNSICGGHGRCECGRCVCDDSWMDKDCSCSLETASCRATNGQLCNGRGSCDCGKCVCQSRYKGPTCETCHSCPETCLKHKECVECRTFGTGPKKDRCDQECGYVNVTMVETKQDLPERGDTIASCFMKSPDDECYVYFTFSEEGEATVTRDKDCPGYFDASSFFRN